MRRALVPLRLHFVPLLLALGPSAVSAQQITSPYAFIETKQGFDVRLGYGVFDSGSLGIGPGSGPLFGIFFGLDLGGPWAFDLGGTAHFSERDVIDPQAEEGERVIATAPTRFTTLDLRLRWGLTGERTWNRIAPFAILGIGVGVDLAGSIEEEAELANGDQWTLGTTAVSTLGVGTRFHPTRRLELRTEGALQLWRIVTPDTWSLESRLGPGISDKEWVPFFYVSFAAAIRF